jgi:hypothetical protein
MNPLTEVHESSWSKKINFHQYSGHVLPGRLHEFFM